MNSELQQFITEISDRLIKRHIDDVIEYHAGKSLVFAVKDDTAMRIWEKNVKIQQNQIVVNKQLS